MKDQSSWSHDCLVSRAMSPTHCDVMRLPRQCRLPIVTSQSVITVLNAIPSLSCNTFHDGGSHMEHFICCDEATTTMFTIKK